MRASSGEAGAPIVRTYGIVGGQQVLLLELRFAGCLAPVLTPAEAEVAALLLTGSTDEQIAQRRGTRVRTVANQIQAIYTKLGMSSRSEVVEHLAHYAASRLP